MINYEYPVDIRQISAIRIADSGLCPHLAKRGRDFKVYFHGIKKTSNYFLRQETFFKVQQRNT